MNTMLKWMTAAWCALTMVACSDEPEPLFEGNEKARLVSVTALFSPADGELPFANNILLNSQTGMLNVPVENAEDVSDPKVALNTLDGFSTTEPWVMDLSGPVDPATVALGRSVYVYQLSADGQSVARALAASEVLVSTVNGHSRLAVIPLKPLAPDTQYLIAVTDELRDTNGGAVVADTTFAFALSDAPMVVDGVSQIGALSNERAIALEPLRLHVNGLEALFATQTSKGRPVMLASFLTQNTQAVMAKVAESAFPHVGLIEAVGTTADFGVPNGQALLYQTTLEVPYYLDAEAPLSSRWRGAQGSELSRFNPRPIVNDGRRPIPLLISVPPGPKPDTFWPVVIFQHGHTQNRGNLIAIADALAMAGFAGVAIDLPLHGITPDSPLKDLALPSERHFGLDLIDETGKPGPDGKVDPSGAHFINLASLATTRDNNRQAAADLLGLRNTLLYIDIDGDLESDFNTQPGNVHFIGHSLGAIAGSLFLAFDDQVDSAVFAMPGGGIARFLQASPKYGPTIDKGLDAQGVKKGSEEYDAFFVAAQTVIDSVDPINHAAAVAANHNVMLFEVLGEEVVVNRVASAPLAGTEPLIRQLGLTPVDEDISDTAGLDVAVRFSAGNHSSILDSTASLAVTQEMQSLAVTFLASGGTLVDFSANSPNVVAPVSTP